jgi:N-methylhydantoinase A
MNAYVSPILKNYLHTLTANLERRGYKQTVYLMQSNGGLIASKEAESRGVLTLMSGPVGGSVGSKALSQRIGKENLVCIDMGGTSFDFSLIVGGEATVTSERKLDELPLLAPMVDIHTIGAGGGSIAWSEAGALRVGPRSAGAVPGPACYGKGGEDPTVTDANLVLGRISLEGFLGGRMQLFPDQAEEAIGRLAGEFSLTKEQMAEGILEVVNAKMANAIRSITVSKGIDPRGFSLVAFGGAGPMHAAFIAEELGISEVIVPNSPGAFSAWGMLETDIRHDGSQTYIVPLTKADWPDVKKHFSQLQDGLTRLLQAERVPPENMRFRRSMDMRYVGQEYFINVPIPEEDGDKIRGSEGLKALFDELYEVQYGHKNLAEDVEIVNLRVEARGLLASKGQGLTSEGTGAENERAARELESLPTRPTIFNGRPIETPFVERTRLLPKTKLSGPMVIEEESCTTVVPPGYQLEVDEHGDLVIRRKGESK